MKRLLAKIAPNKAIGLYIGEHSLTASLVTGTPLGVVEVASSTENYQPEEFADALKRVVRALLGRGKRRSYPVMLGLPAGRVYFSSRPMRTESSDVSPQVLLHEALLSSGLSVDEMVVELLKAQPGKRSVVSLVACRKKYLASLVASIQECGLRPVRAEPALCGLLRAGAHRRKAPRRVRAVLRLFLGVHQGIGIVAVDGKSPLIWRFFDIAAGDEHRGLCYAVRTLQTLIKPCGVDTDLEAVLIHGPASLRQRLESTEFLTDVGIPVVWVDGPGLEDSAIAFGLAMGGLNPAAEVLDLARTLKPPPSLRDIFPWKEVILQVLLLAGMAVFLNDRSATLHHSYLKVQAENQKFAWAGSIALTDLAKEKKDLDKKVDAFRSFLKTRVLWSRYTHDIPDRLPSNVFLTSMQGVFELESMGKGAVAGARRSFILRASAPLRSDGAVPPEIDEFLGTLRQQPLFKRDFPSIEVADIKSIRATGSAQSRATFSVVCLPKIEAQAAVKTPPAKGKGNTPAGK